FPFHRRFRVSCEEQSAFLLDRRCRHAVHSVWCMRKFQQQYPFAGPGPGRNRTTLTRSRSSPDDRHHLERACRKSGSSQSRNRRERYPLGPVVSLHHHRDRKTAISQSPTTSPAPVVGRSPSRGTSTAP